MVKIEHIQAIELLDSRGVPTVEVCLTASLDGVQKTATAVVPSGASTGSFEAKELRDQDFSRYQGKGVLKAIQKIEKVILPHLKDKHFALLSLFDDFLCDLDGTSDKSSLGANAILPVSMAFARVYAKLHQKPLFALFSELMEKPACLPVPMMNILNGGKHADNGLDIQEFMIVPYGFLRFDEALRAGVEVFYALKALLKKQGLLTGVGDEGGFAPVFPSFKGKEKIHEHVIELLLEAIHRAGYDASSQIGIALDCAATEFSSENGYQFEGSSYSSHQLIELYAQWVKRYPVLSIEDGLSESDWDGWKLMTKQIGKRCQIVGDDLFVTNTTFLKRGIQERSANALLVKLNQIGSVTQALDAMRLAQSEGFNVIVSHRSGETEDVFIADFAFGVGAGLIKTGSACRSERVAKYNQLLRLSKETTCFKGRSAFESFF
jgi:enolase